MDWLRKGIWNGPAKQDNKLPQNVQDISRSHKLYRENYEKLESGIDIRREKLSWSKDLGRYIPGRCPITIAICNSDDTTKPYTQKMHNLIQT